MDTTPSKITISKYVADRLVKPAAPQPDPELAAGVSDDLPF
jgi:hypothetical protein